MACRESLTLCFPLEQRAVQQRQVGRAEQQGRVQTPEEAAGGVNLNDLSLEEQKEVITEHPELAAQAGLISTTKSNNKDKKRKQFFHKGTSKPHPPALGHARNKLASRGIGWWSADGCWRWGSRSVGLRVGSRPRRGEHLH